MFLRKTLPLLMTILFFACSSQESKEVSESSQEKINQAKFKSKMELVVELGAVIEQSDLNSRDKDNLMRKFEGFVNEMGFNLLEQNKILSAMINNLSSKDESGMKIKRDLKKRYEQIEKDSSKKRLSMFEEITNSLQGKVSAEKIDEINQMLSTKGFLIIETRKEK